MPVARMRLARLGGLCLGHQMHAAFRTAAGAVLAHLGMHGADVNVARLCMRLRGNIRGHESAP